MNYGTCLFVKKKKKGRKGKEQNMKSMTTLHDQALEAFVLEFDIKWR